ncbi:MAG: BlaI/MecI/CopY family transcriptional regulator [Chloroflexi bacterium]|nr:BlaI/MecI/CopY family transcriptional regulator [Chloroflexota bacterium]
MSVDPDLRLFHPDRPGIRKVLGNLEAEIMEYIWARPPGPGTTVREVFEALYERRRIAYTTVMNTMGRLAKKKLLRVEKSDQAYVYYANFTEAEFVSRFVQRILEDLLVSFTGATVAGFETLQYPEGKERVRKLLEEITRRRTSEQGELCI